MPLWLLAAPAMIAYHADPAEDLLLSQWWTTLLDANEFLGTFTATLVPLSAFLAHFQPPTSLLYEADARGLWAAAWFEPVMSGAFLGFWARRDRRRTRGALEALETALTSGLARWPVLLGVTRSNLLRAHRRLGYTVLGDIPHLWDGRAVSVVMLTQEGFANERQRRRPARASTASAA